MQKSDRIFVAGHRGLVGSAIRRALAAGGYENVHMGTADHCSYRETLSVIGSVLPEYVFVAAARVGGIQANVDRCAEFIRDNLAIQTNIIDASRQHRVKRLLFLGSSCIYPRDCAQPIHESALMTGPLEPTNEPYAMAKLAGISMLGAYRRQYGLDSVCLMPTNLYGPGDKFNDEGAHMVPSLMGRMHRAKLAGAEAVTVWGSGTPRREVMHVDDCARAALHFMSGPPVEGIVNVGTGVDHPIAGLAAEIAHVVGYEGRLVFDASKPDGTPRKVLDVSRAKSLGWESRIGLREGLEMTYRSMHADP